MGIYKVKGRRGRRRYVVSKYWPTGSGRLRVYAPNYRSAQALHTRIESSILDGTWKQLKQELAGGNRTIWTVRSFYERFFEEYCNPHMRSRRRDALSFKSLYAHDRVGAVRSPVGPVVDRLRRQHSFAGISPRLSGGGWRGAPAPSANKTPGS